MKMIDRVGKRFGRLIVVSKAPDNPSYPNKAMWNCLCDCGDKAIIHGRHLGNGSTRSCGCLASESATKRFKGKAYRLTHGLSYTSSYTTWKCMFRRCYNAQYHKFSHYGARGIQVCARWFDLKNFVADMGQRPRGMSIDRIDNDGHYMPSNCKWSTPKEQAANRRVRRFKQIVP